MRTLALAAALVFAAAAGPALATPAMSTFQHGVNGYAGTADTYLKAAEPDTAFGAEPEVSIDASDGTNGLDFATREWAEIGDRPLLTVVTAPVPEPATVASMLAGLALLGALARRRG